MREAPLGLHFVATTREARGCEFVDWLLQDYVPVDALLSRAAIVLKAPNVLSVADDGDIAFTTERDLWDSEAPIRRCSRSSRSHLPMLWSWCRSVDLLSESLSVHRGCAQPLMSRSSRGYPSRLSLLLDSTQFEIGRSTHFHTAARLRILAAAKPGVRFSLRAAFGLPGRSYRYPRGLADLLTEIGAGQPVPSARFTASYDAEAVRVQLIADVSHATESNAVAILDGREVNETAGLAEAVVRGLGPRMPRGCAVRVCVSFEQSRLLGSWVHHPNIRDRPELLEVAEAAAQTAITMKH